MACKLKEPVNGATHCLGAVLAVIGFILLISESLNPIKPWHVAAFSVFSIGMFLLYTASTLYHWLPVSKKGESVLQKLDHAMIFVLIAATYTPVCLIPLRGVWGWSLFGVIWGMAVFGILLRIFRSDLPGWFLHTVYIFMGWISVVMIWPLIQTLQLGALVWILIGGIFYTSGAIINGLKKPNPFPKVLGYHGIFHVLVLFGTFSHFWVMYNYITLFN